MMCGMRDEHCSERVVYRANLETDPKLAAVIVPLCGRHALAVEEKGFKVVPLVHRMWEGGVFA
jgi:hypothetical protein